MGDSGFVAAGKNGGGDVGPHGVPQGESNAGAGFAGRTAADGIDDHHDGPVAGSEDAVDVFRGAGFLDAEAGEIFPHGDKESFRVGHVLNVAESEACD